jgi:hypothetical protein
MKTIYLQEENYNWKSFDYEKLTDLANELEKRKIILGNECELGNRCKLGYGCELGNGCELGTDASWVTDAM